MNPMRRSRHPLVLEIPVRPWLHRLSQQKAEPVTLANVPDSVLDGLRARGFHAVWLMGLWRTSPFARSLALSHPNLIAEYASSFPGWTLDAVDGSPYAIAGYDVSESLGGEVGLQLFRQRLHDRGMSLLVDFVGNHLARDHVWIDDFPERFVQGTERGLEAKPNHWFCHMGKSGIARVFAHGRDPHFDGWSDTVQVDHSSVAGRSAMIDILLSICDRADGVRCDVAMLLLSDVFARTWGRNPVGESGEFWSEAIGRARAQHPEVVFLAEAYWGLESRMIELGFDYSYDKSILDLHSAGDFSKLRRALDLPPADRSRRAHFLENHDEPRARAVFGDRRARAVSAHTFTLPGMRFFFEGQAEGAERRTPIQISRFPDEPEHPGTREFFDHLFAVLRESAFHRGEWRALVVESAHSHDASYESVFGNVWESEDAVWIVVSNLADRPARARIVNAGPLEVGETVYDAITRRSTLSTAKEIGEKGLTVELEPYGFRISRWPGRRSRLREGTFQDSG